MTTFENQITDYPKGARVEAIREIPPSSPSQNYYADPLPRGIRGIVIAHTDDGRAWINFDGHGQECFGHTFEQPEKYIRVVRTHRDDNCPANHEQPRPEQAGGEWYVGSRGSGDATIYTRKGHQWIGQVHARYADQITTEHNQHSTLIAQQERLLTALREMLNRFYPHTCDRGPVCAKCEALVAASKVLTAIEQEGTR